MARPPIALILSYVLDWLVIIVIAAIAGGLNFVKPNHRPFSLLDLDISYPYIGETISTGTLAVVSLIAPAIIILIVVGALVPGPRISRTLSRGQAFQLKLWEFEKGGRVLRWRLPRRSSSRKDPRTYSANLARTFWADASRISPISRRMWSAGSDKTSVLAGHSSTRASAPKRTLRC